VAAWRLGGDSRVPQQTVTVRDLVLLAAAERCAAAAGLRLSPTEKERLTTLLAAMTARQRRVMELTIAGYSTTEIAAQLGVSGNAVHKVRARMARSASGQGTGAHGKG